MLVVIAEKLGSLTEYMGGAEHVRHLLRPLSLLAAVEETLVREATVKSINLVAAAMPSEHISKYFCPFLTALATKDWYTARVSASFLFHTVYPRMASQQQDSIRPLFAALCTDEISMVRRAAAANLCHMAKVIKPAELFSEFMDAFSRLSNDEQDSIRIQVVPNCVAFSSVLPQEVKLRHILPVVMLIASDKSWRVRWSLANQLHEIAQVFGEQVSNSSLSTVFETLLNDGECEVRGAATARMVDVCSFFSKETILTRVVVGAAQRIVTDPSEHVRAALSGVVCGLAAMLGKEDTVTHILPMLLLLLRDEISDVRLGIIQDLHRINSVVGVDMLGQSLLPAIVELAEDSKWRVRLAIIDRMPLLAEQLGRAFFNEKLCVLCLNWLGDDVHSIRRAAADNVRRLAELLGQEWVRENVLPKIESMHNHTSFSHRMTALYVMQLLASVVGPQILETVLLPLATTMCGDPVPNVRFTAAKTLHAIATAGKTKDGLRAQIFTTWNTLCRDDTDRDVKFFATKSLQEMGAARG